MKRAVYKPGDLSCLSQKHLLYSGMFVVFIIINANELLSKLIFLLNSKQHTQLTQTNKNLSFYNIINFV